MVTDGKAVVEINPSRFARPGVKLYATSWQEQIKAMPKWTEVIEISDGYLLADPSGVWIYLIVSEKSPAAIPADCPPSILCSYAGVSIESISIAHSVTMWEILGFDVAMGDIEEGWVSLSNKAGDTVSIMKPLVCPHLFRNPSLTYFNGKNNLDVISQIRSSGVAIMEEVTHFNSDGVVDNVVLADPGGIGMFVFSD